MRGFIAGMGAGDESALGRLYDATVRRVYGLALRITRNPQMAEEVAEDVFWQAWRQALRFDATRGNAMAWPLTMARSRALDALRRADDADLHPEPETLMQLEAACAGDPQNLPDALPRQLLSARLLQRSDARGDRRTVGIASGHGQIPHPARAAGIGQRASVGHERAGHTVMNHSSPSDDDASMLTQQQLLAEALKPVAFDVASSDALRSRRLARVRASLAECARHTIVRRDDGGWSRVVDGVRAKLLNDGTGTRSVLVEFDAGAALPMHRYHEHEQCLVLRGDLQMDDLDIRAGDYHEAPAGSRHGRVSSTGGALIYLRGVPLGDTGSVARDMLSAWLPGRGGSPRTIRAGDGTWTDIGPGVRAKALFEGSEESSMLLRLEPGACLPSRAKLLSGECLVIEGESFVGDTLLRDGEYDCTPDDAQTCELSNDTGALLYLHSRRRPGTTQAASH